MIYFLDSAFDTAHAALYLCNTPYRIIKTPYLLITKYTHTGRAMHTVHYEFIKKNEVKKYLTSVILIT